MQTAANAVSLTITYSDPAVADSNIRRGYLDVLTQLGFSLNPQYYAAETRALTSRVVSIMWPDVPRGSPLYNHLFDNINHIKATSQSKLKPLSISSLELRLGGTSQPNLSVALSDTVCTRPSTTFPLSCAKQSQAAVDLDVGPSSITYNMLNDEEQLSARSYAERFLRPYMDLQKKFLEEGKDAVYDPTYKKEVLNQIKQRIDSMISRAADPRKRARAQSKPFQDFLYETLENMVEDTRKANPELDHESRMVGRPITEMQPRAHVMLPEADECLPSLSSSSLPPAQQRPLSNFHTFISTFDSSSASDVSSSTSGKINIPPPPPTNVSTEHFSASSSSASPDTYTGGKGKAPLRRSSLSTSTSKPPLPALSLGNTPYVRIMHTIPKGIPHPAASSKPLTPREARSQAEKLIEQGKMERTGYGIGTAENNKGKNKGKENEVARSDEDMDISEDESNAIETNSSEVRKPIEGDLSYFEGELSTSSRPGDDSMDVDKHNFPRLNYKPSVESIPALPPSDPPPLSPTSMKRKRDSFDEGINNRLPVVSKPMLGPATATSPSAYAVSSYSSSCSSSVTPSPTSELVKVEDEAADSKDHVLYSLVNSLHHTFTRSTSIREEILRERDETIQSLNDRIFVLEKQKSASEYALQSLKITSENQACELADTQVKLDEVTRLLKVERTTSDTKTKEMQVTLHEKTQALLVAQSELERKTQVLLETQASLTEKSTLCDTLSVTLEDTRAQLAETAKILGNAQASLADKSRSYNALSAMLEATKKELKDQAQLLKNTQASLSSQSIAYENLSATLKATESELDSTRSNVRTLNVEKSALAGSLVAEQQSLSRAQAKITSLETNLRQEREDKEQALRDWESALSDSVVRDNEIETLEFRVASANAKIRTLEQEKDSAAAKSEKAKKEAESMYQRMKLAKEEVECAWAVKEKELQHENKILRNNAASSDQVTTQALKFASEQSVLVAEANKKLEEAEQRLISVQKAAIEEKKRLTDELNSFRSMINHSLDQMAIN